MPAPRSNSSRFYLRVFGPPALLDEHGVPLGTLRTKDLALLIYLRIEDTHSHLSGQLAAMLWGESSESAAKHSLSQAISRIRDVLGEASIRREGDRVRWGGEIRCDVDALRRPEGGGGGGDEELRVYADHFLAGFSPRSPGAQDFDAWADRKRAELRKVVVELLEGRGQAAEAREDWRRALRLGVRVTEIDPLWEQGHRRVMRSWNTLGERNRALRHYQEFAGWLTSEVGTQPDPETQLLAEQLRRAVPDPAPAEDPRAGRPALGATRDLEALQPEQSRAEEPPLQPVPDPTGGPAAGTHEAAARAAGRSPRARRYLGAAALVIGLGAVVWLLAGERSREKAAGGAGAGEGPAPLARSAAVTPVERYCGAGEVSAAIVDEVFHFGVQIRPGTYFGKSWTLQNTGSCTWDSAGIHLYFHSDRNGRFTTVDYPVPVREPVPPRGTYTFTLPAFAPGEPGEYEEHWQLRDRRGDVVPVAGDRVLRARIVVPEANRPVCRPGAARATLMAKKYLDGIPLKGRRRLLFSWTVRNSGECTWDGRVGLYPGDAAARPLSAPSPPQYVTRGVPPGEFYTFLVPMLTPERPGSYRETWELRDGSGARIPVGEIGVVHAQVKVLEPDVPETHPPFCRPGETNVRFLDENYPDDSVLRPGQRFTKAWTVANRGTCSWHPATLFRFVSASSGVLSVSQQPLAVGEVVPPNATYTFLVPMQAPTRPGTYREDWRVVDSTGERIDVGHSATIWVQIVVPET